MPLPKLWSLLATSKQYITLRYLIVRSTEVNDDIWAQKLTWAWFNSPFWSWSNATKFCGYSPNGPWSGDAEVPI